METVRRGFNFRQTRFSSPVTPAVPYRPWLFRFAALTALGTLALIGIGGLVTSHGAGMAVPDWPTSYGYNMFLFPISLWKGGIFYEHTHRLFASFVGLLTTILAVWIALVEERRWMKILGGAAFLLVVLQGVLGGLRVVWLEAQLGIVHATLAQLFLALTVALALFTSRWWRRWEEGEVPVATGSRSLRFPFLAATCLILGQLILGATMRHQHAGLAVPDFPLAYGKLWPPMDAASLAEINQTRVDARDFGPVSAFQIGLHMAHRVGALVILLAVGFAAWLAGRSRGGNPALAKMSKVWLGAIVLQALLGAATIWSNKAADVATIHVLLGAASLAWGGLITLVSFKFSVAEEKSVLHSSPALSQGQTAVDRAKTAFTTT
jgi:heme a synthase